MKMWTSKKEVGLTLSLLSVIVVILALLMYSPVLSSASVIDQLDIGTKELTITYEDVGNVRTYTVHNVMLNDDPFVLRTGYGTESVESMFKRSESKNNGHLIFQSNADYVLKMLDNLGETAYADHTGWSGKFSLRENNQGSWVVKINKGTTNGHAGTKYSYKELSDSIERNQSKFPQELLDKLQANPDARVFEVLDDSRIDHEDKWSMTGGFQFVATETTDYYKAGDGVHMLYYDNIVYVTARINIEMPPTGGGETCPDGSPLPPSGDIADCGDGGGGQTCPDGSPLPSSGNIADCGGGGGGGNTQTCPDGSPLPPSGDIADCGGGSGGGCADNCTPPPPPPPPDTDPECHPSALGSYPNCYADEIDLQEEFEREYFPTWGVGEISWGLSKVTKAATGGSPTQIASTNLLPIGDGHYEALTPTYTQSGVLTGSRGKTTPRNVTASDLGTEVYAVNYDFTNWAIETYKCTAPAESTVTQTNIEGGVESSYDVTAYDYSNCYESFSDTSSYWELVDERADWSKGETYSCTQNLAVDHSYNTILKGKNSVSGTYNLGRHADVQAYANSCNIISDDVFTETISHVSEHKKLNTQTYIEFVEKPVTWQGNPNYDTTTVMPYVADTNSQGDMGVPELDGVFKKNNKYTTPTAVMQSPYNIPLRQQVTGTSMKVLSKDDFWVSRSTGFVYSVPAPSTAASATNEIATKFKDYTGQNYRDVILNRPQLTSMYYLPIDPNENVMKPNTVYSLEMFLRNIGYNNITIQHEQTYEFKHYLLGSVFEETNPNVTVKIVEQNEIPYKDIKYPYSATLTVKQAEDMYDVTHGRENFIFGHKATDAMAVFDKGVGIIGIDFGQKVDNPLPHVIDRESANDTLYTEWD